MHTPPTRIAIGFALFSLLTVIWLVTHPYQGLSQDARIYAVQAMAKLNPALQSDLYLQNTSQDRYTLFSPFYAAVIRVAGLNDAARLLTVGFTVWFFAAAWAMADRLMGRDEAWLAVGVLALTVGIYGSHRVFHFSEDYLTARVAAEALIATALAVHVRGGTRLALGIAIGALMVHPLMALPGVLLLIFLSAPGGVSAALAIAGVAAVFAVTLAVNLPAVGCLLPVLDTAWLQVVRERSQFLFLQLWSLPDWEINARPFASLALTAMVFDARIRRVCTAAALVGASGLAVAALAGTSGPVALLLQGQAWRWVWITAFVSALLMIPTAMRVAKDTPFGPMCALLLIGSWTLPDHHAPSLVLAAFGLFLIRAHFPSAMAKSMKWATLALGLAMLYWVSMRVSDLKSAPGITEPSGLLRPAAIAVLRLPLMILFLLAWQRLRMSRTAWVPGAICVASTAAAVVLAPLALREPDSVGTPWETAAFAEWQNAIPPAANVYLADGRDAASFAWFTLQRPSYLSLDQSAGVIFSRATALEVERRSAVLLPLMDEDWKLLSKNKAAGNAGAKAPRWTPLTAQSVVRLCSDPQLGFLIAREDVGFDPMPHRHAGLWQGWNLYDCRHVRHLAPPL